MSSERLQISIGKRNGQAFHAAGVFELTVADSACHLQSDFPVQRREIPEAAPVTRCPVDDSI
jgi:hypothetical protein